MRGIAAPPLIASMPPPVLTYYRLWCGLFMCLWLAMGTYGLLQFAGVIHPRLDILEEIVARNDESQRDPLVEKAREDSLGVAAVSVVALAFYAFAIFVPRQPWGWMFGLIAIVGTLLPFIVTAVGMVPILIHWARPETKRYFQVRP